MTAHDSVDPEALEQSGQLEKAAEGYLQIERNVDAARLYVRLGQARTAAESLVAGLRREAGPFVSLRGNQRRQARTAALLYQSEGMTNEAAEIFEELGDILQAAKMLRACGDNNRADALLEAHGLAEPSLIDTEPELAPTIEADIGEVDLVSLVRDLPNPTSDEERRWGQVASEAVAMGDFYRAAYAHLMRGRVQLAVDALMWVRPEDPRYRPAVIAAVVLAERVRLVDMRFAYFTRPFVDSGVEEGERDSFEALGSLFRQHGFPEEAARVESLLSMSLTDSSIFDAPTLTHRMESNTPTEPLIKRHQSDPAPSPPAKNSAPPFVSPLNLPIGSFLTGRIEITKRLGRGETAIVYEGLDHGTNRPVALKILLPIAAPEVDEAEQLERFQREVGPVRKLRHPNVVEMYEIGSAQGLWFIVMERLEGQALNQVIVQQILRRDHVIEVLMQALRGLHYAHEQGIVHQDVRPHNIFITRKGRVKMTDFKVAQAMEDATATQTAILMRKPRYMAPEQSSGFQKATAASDIYAAGVVAYELLTGQKPFSGDPAKVLLGHLNTPPKPPRKLVPELPAELEALVLQMLEKSPAARPESAEAVVEELRRIRKQYADS